MGMDTDSRSRRRRSGRRLGVVSTLVMVVALLVPLSSTADASHDRCGTLGCSVLTIWRGQPAWFDFDVGFSCDSDNGRFSCTAALEGAGPHTFHWTVLDTDASIRGTGDGRTVDGTCIIGRRFHIEVVALDDPQPWPETNLVGSRARRSIRCPEEPF